jgi:hypothetical protein
MPKIPRVQVKKQSFKNNFLQEFLKNNLDKLLKINNK